MSIEDMRHELIMEYPNSEKWKIKCAFMPDYQVLAIYKSIRNRKKKYREIDRKDPGFEQIKFDLGSLM